MASGVGNPLTGAMLDEQRLGLAEAHGHFCQTAEDEERAMRCKDRFMDSI
jgi:hypothetical protein